MFLEVHQPIGHRQIVDVEDLAVVLESGGIFAVRVKHHDMAFGRHFTDPVKDQRGRGRFAGAGRAEQGEMLAEHCVDEKRCCHVYRGIDGADPHMRSEEHTSELQSLMRISYAVFCMKNKTTKQVKQEYAITHKITSEHE